MGPLGPPMPRSQTIGSLTSFADAAEATTSLSKRDKRNTRAISTISHRNEGGVMKALAESKMTGNEIKYFKQVALEVEANRQRMEDRIGAIGRSSDYDGNPLASSKTMTSFAKPKSSSEPIGDDCNGVAIGDSSKKPPFQKARFKTVSGSSSSITPPIMSPDFEVSMGTHRARDWEVNVKLVRRPQDINPS